MRSTYKVINPARPSWLGFRPPLHPEGNFSVVSDHVAIDVDTVLAEAEHASGRPLHGEQGGLAILASDVVGFVPPAPEGREDVFIPQRPEHAIHLR